jgi:tungstate transport system substrate-binding protein
MTVVRKFLAAAIVAVAVGAVGAASAQAVAVKVYGTTDITDSNLLAGLMAPAFATHTGGTDSISYTALGSGAAIAAAEVASNHADALMVHSPSQEAGFVSGGFSVEPLGRPIFYNDYVIVGPTSDPAGVLSGAPHDAAKAFSLIATSGGSGGSTFLSRNDASGTNTQEQVIWCQAGSSYSTTVHTVTTGHCAPGATTFPSWYAPTGLGQGMNLRAANTCSTGTYPNGHCYTMVDRGTYLYEKSQSHTGNLKIVSNINSSGAPGGVSLLTNPFHAYAVSTSPNNPTQALDLVSFITGSTFQAQLANFPVSPSASNIPDAAAAIAPGGTFPTSGTCVPQNSNITITEKMVYAPPVSVALTSMPVWLQAGSTSTGLSDIAGPTNTDASGNVTFTTNVGTTDKYYGLRTAQFDVSASNVASRFSPNVNQNLGDDLDGFVDVC